MIIVRKIFIFLLIIPFCLISQSNNIELLDQWYIEGLPITNDGESVFNDVWGLEIENDKYVIDDFEAEVVILHHATTIKPNYQAVVHCGVIR